MGNGEMNISKTQMMVICKEKGRMYDLMISTTAAMKLRLTLSHHHETALVLNP